VQSGRETHLSEITTCTMCAWQDCNPQHNYSPLTLGRQSLRQTTEDGTGTNRNVRHTDTVFITAVSTILNIISIITGQLTNSMEQNPWQADSGSGNQEIRHIYVTGTLITVFTRDSPHRSLPWARWIQSTNSHPISPKSILILSSHQRLCLLNDLFFSGF
jgi:hypothetical protein